MKTFNLLMIGLGSVTAKLFLNLFVMLFALCFFSFPSSRFLVRKRSEFFRHIFAAARLDDRLLSADRLFDREENKKHGKHDAGKYFKSYEGERDGIYTR